MGTIDQNSRWVGLGYVEGTKNMVLPFSINPTNNKLLIEIIPRADPMDPLVAISENIRIDENTRQAAAAITDDSNKTITTLTTDSIAGLPCIRVEL